MADSLPLPPPRRARPWLVAVYVLIVLAFFEGSARLVLANEAFLRRVACNDDAWWRLSWFQRHRGSLDTPVYYTFDVYHPTRGWALAPHLRDVHAMPVRGEKVLNTNSRGLRGLQEHAAQVPPGKRRILALGDSFTFGEDVDDHETWCARLQEISSEVEVLNLGVHGYGLDQERIALEEEGLGYRPDLVLLGFVYDDMDRLVLSFRDFAKPRYSVRTGRLRLLGSPVPTPQSVLEREKWHPRLADLLDILGHRFQLEAATRESQAITDALLRDVVALTRQGGAEPVLVYLPTGAEVLDASPTPTEREQWTLDHAQAAGLRTILLRPWFARAAARGVTLHSQGHWSEVEHSLAAEALRSELGLEPAVP